jgi:peptidoglycan/xylan/chitin deacetylase (PgdA/CDA1 family)
MNHEQRRARREQRRRELHRRRRTAALLGVVFAGIAAVIVLIAASASSRHAPDRASAAVRDRHSRPTPARAAVPPARGDGRPGAAAVPILMYHVIAPPPAGAPFPGLYVTPEEFAEQMQVLADAGWHGVTMDQVAAYWRDGAALGQGRPIVVSFDNGYQSQYTQALPVLRRLGWVGDENIQLTGLPPSQGGLGPDEVRGLLAAGWELDTQGFSHADLIALDPERLHHEVADSRRVLQQRYGIPVNWFCYPSGHYDAAVLAAVKAAGYAGSTTVVPGWAHRADDPYRLHRLRVLGGTSGPQLLAEIAAIRDDPPAPAAYGGA